MRAAATSAVMRYRTLQERPMCAVNRLHAEKVLLAEMRRRLLAGARWSQRVTRSCVPSTRSGCRHRRQAAPERAAEARRTVDHSYGNG